MKKDKLLKTIEKIIKSDLKKMSRPILKVPHEKGISSRPDQEVYSVDQASKKRLPDKLGDEYSGQDISERKLETAIRDDKYQNKAAYGIDPNLPKKIATSYRSQMRSPSQGGVKGLFVPGKKKNYAFGDTRAKGVREHEGSHLLAQQIIDKHGMDAAHKFYDSLLEHVHPKVHDWIDRTLQTNQNYKNMSVHSNPRYQLAYKEEKVNLLRDILTNPQRRNLWRQSHLVNKQGKSLHENPLHEQGFKINDVNAKKSWSDLVNHAKQYQFKPKQDISKSLELMDKIIIDDLIKGELIDFKTRQRIEPEEVEAVGIDEYQPPKLHESYNEPHWQQFHERFRDSEFGNKAIKEHQKLHDEPYKYGDTHDIQWGNYPAELKVHGHWNKPFSLPVKTHPDKVGGILGRNVHEGGVDPFQYMDRKYRTSYNTLKDHKDLPLEIHTRSDLIAADDYIKELNPNKHTVHIHFFTDNDEVGKKLEPGAPSFKRRLKAVKKLREAGIPVKMVHNRINNLNPDLNRYDKRSIFKVLGDLNNLITSDTTMEGGAFGAKNNVSKRLGENSIVNKKINKSEPHNINKWLKKAELMKGSFQQRNKFNPQSYGTENLENLGEWQTDSSKEGRDESPRLEGAGRNRALKKLASLTDVKHINGEPHYLFHRGMSNDEYDKYIASHGNAKTNYHDEWGAINSWTPKYDKANVFAKDYQISEFNPKTGKKQGHVVSAWIPQSAIHNYLPQLGDPSASKHSNPFKDEHEVLIQHTDPYHLAHPDYVVQRTVAKPDVHESINERYKTKEDDKSKIKGKFVQSGGMLSSEKADPIFQRKQSKLASSEKIKTDLNKSKWYKKANIINQKPIEKGVKDIIAGAGALATLATGAYKMDSSKDNIINPQHAETYSVKEAPDFSLKSDMVYAFKQNPINNVPSPNKPPRYGQYGLYKDTIVNTIKNNRGLKTKYGNILQLDSDELHQHLVENPHIDKKIATKHWENLQQKFGNQPDKIAHAWYHGHDKTNKELSQRGRSADLSSHFYVNKILNSINYKK